MAVARTSNTTSALLPGCGAGLYRRDGLRCALFDRISQRILEMKCPACLNQHKKSAGPRCRCGYPFVFTDPSAQKMSDFRFLAIIDGATGDGTYYVTARQLYFEYCRRLGSKGPLTPAITAVSALGVATGLWLSGYDTIAVFCGFFAVVGLVICLYRLFSPPMKFLDFERVIDRYREGGTRERLSQVLEKPTLHNPPPDWQEPDIYRYGVERVLLVQHDILVDLFVLNGLHAEQRTLIISETGYPEYIQPRVTEVLKDNPKIPVFMLHDATDRGIGMKRRLRKLSWLPASEKRIDLGIQPKDVRKMKRFRFLRPQRLQYKVAIDLLPYSVLAGGLAAGLAGQIALAAVTHEQLSARGESSFG